MYWILIAVILFFAIADLIVGVSNDAINFLNSAIGSKVASLNSIMIVVAIGICLGTVFSNDMMEVARKGIFNPQAFYLKDILIIFFSVMVVDILLLNYFNSIGIPTSTTVSIVFELLGAAVAIAIVKNIEAKSFVGLSTYINTEKAVNIVLGIFISIVIAFVIGALIQFVTRVVMTFNYQKKPIYVAGIFAGLAFTSITYFILFKGLNSLSTFSASNLYIKQNINLLIFTAFVFWTGLSVSLIYFFKVNVFKLVVLIGTFALALAFAGNDLVNFIGVPLAAFQALQSWNASGIDADSFSMHAFSQEVHTPIWILLGSGLIMITALWFSKKAKYVIKTSVDLSRQEPGEERFASTVVSRSIVQFSRFLNRQVLQVVPNRVLDKINLSFEKPSVNPIKEKADELPAFDLVRASVNLMVASVLISMATDRQLPLSTTYITFMVAMGTSMADRAWGSDIAVNRISGVLKVLSGFLFTALAAFLLSGILAVVIYYAGIPAAIICVLFTFFVLLLSYINHRKSSKEIAKEQKLKISESKTIKGIIDENAENVSKVLIRSSEIFTLTVSGLALGEIKELKTGRQKALGLVQEIEMLRDNIFFSIKNIEDASVGASRVYILILDDLQQMVRSINRISEKAYAHVNDHHKSLRFNQIKELRELDLQIQSLFAIIKATFDKKSFENISSIYEEKKDLITSFSVKIDRQVARTRTDESSPKNTALYFSLLLETKELIDSVLNLITLYYKENRLAKEVGREGK